MQHARAIHAIKFYFGSGSNQILFSNPILRCKVSSQVSSSMVELSANSILISEMQVPTKW